MRLKRPAALNIGIDLVAPSELPIVDWAVNPAPQFYTSRAHPSKLASSAEATVFGDGIRPRFEFHQGDGITFIENRHFEPDEFLYCDPPYLPSTRSGRRLYTYEMTNADHRRFLRAIRGLPCMVMISGYWSQMYASALKGWNVVSYEAMTRGGPAVEYLWFNFPPPVALHDYRYLGANFRERERIKRQKARWTARLLRMPPLQRQALLAAIAETDFSGDTRSTSTSAVSGVPAVPPF